MTVLLFAALYLRAQVDTIPIPTKQWGTFLSSCYTDSVFLAKLRIVNAGIKANSAARGPAHRAIDSVQHKPDPLTVLLNMPPNCFVTNGVNEMLRINDSIAGAHALAAIESQMRCLYVTYHKIWKHALWPWPKISVPSTASGHYYRRHQLKFFEAIGLDSMTANSLVHNGRQFKSRQHFICLTGLDSAARLRAVSHKVWKHWAWPFDKVLVPNGLNGRYYRRMIPRLSDSVRHHELTTNLFSRYTYWRHDLWPWPLFSRHAHDVMRGHTLRKHYRQFRRRIRRRRKGDPTYEEEGA